MTDPDSKPPAFAPPVAVPRAGGRAPHAAPASPRRPAGMCAATVARGRELVRPAAALRKRGPLSAAEVDEFYREGFVVARGLLRGDALARALAAREALPLPNREAPGYGALKFRLWEAAPVFREIAVRSPLAAAAAQLTPAPPRAGAAAPGRELVVLRDALFVLQGAQSGCGFHVDDPFFWPAPWDAPGPGVNAWLALDPVGADGGGLALARRSFTERFLDCRDAIRPHTCSIAKIAPALAARLEREAVVPHMQPGDVILHTRFAFHRAQPFVPGSAGARGRGIARYSVRYMPGHAEFQNARFENGNVVYDDPVPLTDVDSEEFPAWEPDEE